LPPTTAAEKTFLVRSIGVSLRGLSERIEAWKGEGVGLGIALKTLTPELRNGEEGDAGKERAADSSIESVATTAAPRRSSPRVILVHKKTWGRFWQKECQAHINCKIILSPNSRAC